VSSPVLPPLWSPAQQSWLQAMGYTVFVDGSVAPEPMVAPAAQIDLSAAPVVARAPVAPAAPDTRPDIAPVAAPADAPVRRTAPLAAEAPPAPARARAGRRPAVQMPDRLQIALLRASGCNPNAPETQALMAGWALDELRGNPAAKRALWPQLRALRRQGRS
jgi:hypothetical protein